MHAKPMLWICSSPLLLRSNNNKRNRKQGTRHAVRASAAAAAMKLFVMKSPVREFFGRCVVQHLVCSFPRARGRWQLFHMQQPPIRRPLLWGWLLVLHQFAPGFAHTTHEQPLVHLHRVGLSESAQLASTLNWTATALRPASPLLAIYVSPRHTQPPTFTVQH